MIDDGPMRLAFVADPNSVHTRRWIAWFARAGHEVVLIDAFGAGVEPGLPDGVSIERPDPAPTRPPLVPRSDGGELRSLVERIRPDVVHAHFVRRHGWHAARTGFHPFVVSPWGSDILRAPWWKVRTRLWNRFALRAADLVTVSSEGMRRASIASGARPDRIELVNHGVDTAHFMPGEPSPALAERIGADRGPVVVSLRSIRPLYRQPIVVEAVARASGERHRPILVMSARGADPDELRLVRARADALGMGDRLHILDDVAHDELPDLLRLADVVVSVPETDSFPLSLLEAMACGAPVVASDLPAVTPVYGPLDPVAPQLVVPVGDVAATAAALERALRLTDDERARLAGALRDFVTRTADYDGNMARMERLYRRLVAAR